MLRIGMLVIRLLLDFQSLSQEAFSLLNMLTFLGTGYYNISSKNPKDWLFYSLYTGNPIKPSALTMYLRRLVRRLGLNPDLLHPHNLRHLRATELYKSRKFTELEMMEWFGWKTRQMIDIYSKITMDDIEERIRELYGIKRLHR